MCLNKLYPLKRTHRKGWFLNNIQKYLLSRLVHDSYIFKHNFLCLFHYIWMTWRELTVTKILNQILEYYFSEGEWGKWRRQDWKTYLLNTLTSSLNFPAFVLHTQCSCHMNHRGYIAYRRAVLDYVNLHGSMTFYFIVAVVHHITLAC